MPDRRNIVPFPGARPVPAVAAEPAPALDQAVLLREGRRLLDGLTLRLPGAGITALLGPPGSGKSIALEVLAGLEAPDLGAVRTLTPATALALRGASLLRRTVRANLDLALRAADVPRRARPERIEQLLALAALGPLADRPAPSLSAAEARRLVVARALVANPRLLLLDMPTERLDERGAAGVEAVIQRAAEDGVEVLLATDDPRQAARLAARTIFVHRGRDLETGPTAELLARPANEMLRGWLSGNLLA